mgnify:CR=1 FL=1
MFWLGIDIGTGGSRALLIDEKGTVRHAFTAPHEDMKMERPLWAEQRPENWWDASQAAIRGVLAQAGVTGADVTAVGLSGQMHGLTLLDEANQVIRPALIWCDQRSQAQVDWINAKAGKQAVLDAIANPVLTGFTLPKLLWVRDNEPRHYERVRKVLLPKDYVRYQLTGEHASDVSDASGTALFDVVHRRWSTSLAEKLGIDRSILPYVYESPDVSGRVTAAAAASTGLKEGTPVVGGAGDQAASAVGNGIVDPGVVSCTIGTSGVVFAYTQKPAYDPEGRVHTFCHAVPGAWHVMGVTQGAGLSLQWFRNQLAPGADYDQLTAEAATSCVCAQGLFWLPYLMGERTPIWDTAARGVIFGLSLNHTKGHLVRAMMEAVAYALYDSYELLLQAGLPIKYPLVLNEGGAVSKLWRQIITDVFNVPTVLVERRTGAPYGDAILAGVAMGVLPSFDVAKHWVKYVAQMDPDPGRHARYMEYFTLYRRLYRHVKEDFQALAALRDLPPPV